MVNSSDFLKVQRPDQIGIKHDSNHELEPISG